MPISPRRVAGSTYLRTLKKKTYSTFKRHDCMEGKSVADERGRRERKFSERRRSEALVRERNVSEEVSGRAMRKLFCNRLHRKKRSFGQFSLDVKTLIRVSKYIFRAVFRKNVIFIEFSPDTRKYGSKEKRLRGFQSYSVTGKL